MKILIAITSCKKDALEGVNQAQRDTFLKDISKYPNLEYRFFIGDGTPTKDDDLMLTSSVKGCADKNRGIDYEQKHKESEQNINKYIYNILKPDEVLISVPDDYIHLVYKVREIHRWAVANNFDYVFKCDSDTYVNLDRLMESGFENYDLNGGQAGIGAVAGGGGYWTSRKASKLLVDAPIIYWAEDVWVSNTLRKANISLHVDSRYSDNPVKNNNNLISTHVGFKAGYKPSMMYDIHTNKDNAEKILITISSWVKGAINGDNQAMRDTFLKNISQFPNLDYRFFIGDGTPTGDNETELLYTLKNKFSCPGHIDKALSTKQDKPFTYVPKDDEVILHVPDGYLYMSYKTRGSHSWALDNGYDYIFQCFPDTFIDLQRLMNSGFQRHDYTGLGLAGGYASGGCGYWLSKKAARYLINSPIADWAEDRWVGSVLSKNKILLYNDVRYAGKPFYPNLSNNLITSHLCDTPKIYDCKEMYETYRLSLVPGPLAPKLSPTIRPMRPLPPTLAPVRQRILPLSPARHRILPKFQRRSVIDKTKFK